MSLIFNSLLSHAEATSYLIANEKGVIEMKLKIKARLQKDLSLSSLDLSSSSLPLEPGAKNLLEGSPEERRSGFLVVHDPRSVH